MTDTDLILDKLDAQEKAFSKMDTRLTGIEKAVTDMAVQKKEIDFLTQQMNALWRKYDSLCGADGFINQIKNYQSGCPGESLKTSIAQLWGAIVLIVGLIGAIKIWG